jgi:hypothetical protein
MPMGLEGGTLNRTLFMVNTSKRLCASVELYCPMTLARSEQECKSAVNMSIPHSPGCMEMKTD